MRILALVTDAFGECGGIAEYSRDFLTALDRHDRVVQVLTIPRHCSEDLGALPEKLDFRTEGISSLPYYLSMVLRSALSRRGWVAVFCGHINLMPLASFLGRALACPVLLQIHGIDARKPPHRWLNRRCIGRANAVLSVSEFTLDRFLGWSGLPRDCSLVVPNTYDPRMLGTDPKPLYLAERYGVEGKVVLLTLGRLVSKERAKGFDQVLEVLPRLSACGTVWNLPALCRNTRKPTSTVWPMLT